MKYLLILLPFMWGCGEKKERYPIYVVAGHDTIIFQPNGSVDLTKCRASSSGWINYGTDSVYRVYSFDRHGSLACGELDYPKLRQGISIDPDDRWNDAYDSIYFEGISDSIDYNTIGSGFNYTSDSLPGGHSIHCEPYDTVIQNPK